MYDIDALRQLMLEYIKEVEEKHKEWGDTEFYMTMPEYAEWQIEPFLDWIEKRNQKA
jgi:hypothetical protein